MSFKRSKVCVNPGSAGFQPAFDSIDGQHFSRVIQVLEIAGLLQSILSEKFFQDVATTSGRE